MLENGSDPGSITLSKYGESMHLAPNGREGCLYTAEEVYEMLPSARKPGQLTPSQRSAGAADGRARKKQAKPENGVSAPKIWDDHSQWGKFEDDSILRDVWVKRFAEACEAITVRDPSSSHGTLPMFAQRLLQKLIEPQTDWRSILNEFIQEEITDYSFSPPDRRFQDSPFFLSSGF